MRDPYTLLVFLSTPSVRRATLSTLSLAMRCLISIHALREEGDTGPWNQPEPTLNISIHALREEGD